MYSSLSVAKGVDAALIASENERGQDWLSHGFDYREQRHSPLKQINQRNVGKLGIAWSLDLPSTRGLEATPLVINGVMYTTGTWSRVYAINAKTGQLLWEFDPKVDPVWAFQSCCDVVNRGVAAWGDSVFVGTIDGRLIALDAATGQVQWDVNTIDRYWSQTITGAPRVVKGKVIIGHGGADMGARGYVSAYDAISGERLWRFFTVPGNPADGFESDTMAMAAKTWTGEWWKFGGGGTVWDSMAYDEDLDLLYIGVGNGGPWDSYHRSKDGGDNLFVSSIVALRPDTGDYVWHYQTTPGDRWDYTATQHMVLADIEHQGLARKVLMQAPKNGFFYVIDRSNGELISAEPYVKVNWAERIDLATGRPVLTDSADYKTTRQKTFPSMIGGHNWHPSAYNPELGLFYIPAIDQSGHYSHDPNYEFKRLKGVNVGVPMGTEDAPGQLMAVALQNMFIGKLTAWDPITQSAKWSIDHGVPWNAGVLSTAGDLVFQARTNGFFSAYNGQTGERLLDLPLHMNIMAPPISYQVDGKQYITVMAGWGGALGMTSRPTMAAESAVKNRVITFSLDGDAQLPAPIPIVPQKPPVFSMSYSDEERLKGLALYDKHCMRCHGIPARGHRVIADLSYSTLETHEIFDAIVLGGLYQAKGMIGFADQLTMADSHAIHAYIVSRSEERAAEFERPSWLNSVLEWFYTKLIILIN